MNHTLELLVPGQEVEVQIAVKCALNDNAGHWSGWSQPERAVVPQSAGEFQPEGDQWVSSAGTGTTSWDLHRQQQQQQQQYEADHFHSNFSDDISLLCLTPDLERITCQWNGSRDGAETECKAFYMMDLR